MIERPYRTAAEAANLIGVHVNTVKRIPAREMPYHVISRRGDRRYRIEDVRAYIEARAVR
jgi:hypothetical protein